MIGKHVLDTAFFVGLLIQLTKLSDLIFRENQKKFVQDKLETWTLRMENVRPAKYFFIIFNNKIRRLFLLFLPIVISIRTFFNVLNVFDSLFHYFFAFGLSLIAIYFTFELYGMRIVKWMTKDNFINFSGRYLIMIAPAFCVIYFHSDLDQMFEYIFFNNASKISNSFISVICIIILVGTIGFWEVIFVYGCIVILFQLVIWILEIFIRASRFILWRIVEYNKGAVAAISLIITVILGVLDFIIT
jgi:hypothetical protein